MTEGMEDISSGTVSPGVASVDTGQVPEEKDEEAAADKAGPDPEEGGGPDEEQAEAEGVQPLPVACCVCVQMEHIHNCVHSEKICILPILACLLSLALCTAGLKWVFVDKIFEYEPPTHLDPKPIGQDPFIITADPTAGLTLPPARPSASTSPPSAPSTPGRPEVLLEDKSTQRPLVPLSPKVTVTDSSVTLKYNAEKTTAGKPSGGNAQSTHGLSSNDIPTISTTSSTTTLKTSSHVTRCSNSQRKYCVNGGECFTLEIMPGSTKFLCRCPNEFTGDRCQHYVMASSYKAEELYQKRILTITGICIALLVVGIMCVVAYCRTKKERKKLQDRLKQSLRRKRKSSNRGRPSSQLTLQNLQQPNKNSSEAEEAAVEKDTETTVSSSKYPLSANEPTAVTLISQRRVSAAPSPATPGSPPSEMSAPLSSLAASVPSVAVSPSVEEERPLLQRRFQPHGEHKRPSAHDNHGLDAHSLPSSPLLFRDSAGELERTTTGHTPPPELLHQTDGFEGAAVAVGRLLLGAQSSDSLLQNQTQESQGSDTTTAPLLWARTTPTTPHDPPPDPPPDPPHLTAHVPSRYTTVTPDPAAV